MIGDNLRTDILGANTINNNSSINLVSIAVKTGLFKSEGDIDAHSNQTGIPKELLAPKIVVKDFQEAIEKILQFECQDKQ